MVYTEAKCASSTNETTAFAVSIYHFEIYSVHLPTPQAILPMDFQEPSWGAVLLGLVTALPHLAVHQEKRHVWVAEDTIGAVHRGSINCCKNAFATWR